MTRPDRLFVLDAERTDQELWPEPPPSLGRGPAIQVDTTGDVDLGQVVAQLDQVLAR